MACLILPSRALIGADVSFGLISAAGGELTWSPNSAVAREEQAFTNPTMNEMGEVWIVAGGNDCAGNPRQMAIVQRKSFDATKVPAAG